MESSEVYVPCHNCEDNGYIRGFACDTFQRPCDALSNSLLLYSDFQGENHASIICTYAPSMLQRLSPELQ